MIITEFSADLAQWPSFWYQVTQFRTWPRTQDKHFVQDSWWLLEKCDRQSDNKILRWFGQVT